MPSDVTKYFLYMQKQGLRVSTMKKHFSFFNSIFKYAIYILVLLVKILHILIVTKIFCPFELVIMTKYTSDNSM